MSKYQLKQDLKKLAGLIRNGKSGRKPKNRTDKNRRDYNQSDINRCSYRHMHIAYCLMRGTPRGLIEQPAENNLPNEERIKFIMEDYANV